MDPVLAHVGSAVIEHDIRLPGLELLLEVGASFVRGDVIDHGNGARDGLDEGQIHAHDQRGHGHVLLGHLHPGSRSGAQIDADPGLLQELKLPVELDQLEGGAK